MVLVAVLTSIPHDMNHRFEFVALALPIRIACAARRGARGCVLTHEPSPAQLLDRARSLSLHGSPRAGLSDAVFRVPPRCFGVSYQSSKTKAG
jgi:hypothetical protein